MPRADVPRWALTTTLAAIALTSCAAPRDVAASTARTRCAQVVSNCTATRLADLTLTGGGTDGALGSADGMDLHGLITFDEAFARGAAEAPYPDARTVRVVLGSTDASALHWGDGTNLYYVVEWTGVCVPVAGPSPSPGGWSAPSTACDGAAGTVLDAHTGRFIVTG
jgi:hypothetical protein